MKKFIVCVVLLLVGLGLGFKIPHGAKTEGPVGGAPKQDASFVYGLHAGSADQFTVTPTGAVIATTYGTYVNGNTATTTSSTAPNLAFGAAAAGIFTIGTSTPAINYANVSSTAVTLNSEIFLSTSATTTVAGTTCNSQPSTTWVSVIYPGSGFQIKTLNTPPTNPVCGYWRLTN